MESRITGGDTTVLFTAKVLGKYDVKFFRCNDTGFIQTEDPYWLSEAYDSAITKLDVGLVKRNLQLAELAEPIILDHFNHNGIFLDYAGGYGLFTRLMRDKGFAFYNTDKYCDNILAEYHDLKELKGTHRFELVTAFEVFEHLPDPVTQINEMLEYSDNLLFSTELVPTGVSKVSDWWYFIPETGQHVAFYTNEALQYMAEKHGLNFYTDGKFVHLFTRKKLTSNPLVRQKKEPFLIRKFRKYVQRYEKKSRIQKDSLLDSDWQEAKRRLEEHKLSRDQSKV